MGLFDRFPWVNTHDLNLDWIIQKMKEWGADAAENVAKAETAATNAAANAAAGVAGVAERAEAAADRAETAKSGAEIAQDSANISANRAVSYYQQARDAATNAEASATEASRIEAVVEGYAQDCNSASASAQASATAAAKSAQEAASAGFAYGNYDRGYAYKMLNSVDSRTGNDKEYLNSPTFFGEEMVRVSGSGGVLWGENMGQSAVDYHYEKIYLLDTRSSTSYIDITDDVSGKHLKPYRIECVALINDLGPGNETLTNAPYVEHALSEVSLIDGSICYYASNNHLQITTSGEYSEYLYIRVYFTESGLG